MISFPIWVSITLKYDLLYQPIEHELICLLDKKSDVIS